MKRTDKRWICTFCKEYARKRSKVRHYHLCINSGTDRLVHRTISHDDPYPGCYRIHPVR